MRRFHPRPGLLAVLLHLAACGGGGENARSCRLDADCGAEGEAYCARGTCIANGAPSVAVLAPPGPILTNTLLAFAATVAEPEGEAVQVSWSVAPTSDGCPGDADAKAGATLAAEVAFWCPGTYEVVATAADPWGHAASGRAIVAVAQATGAPGVTAGPDLAVDHRCQGEPLRCEATSSGASTSFLLSASGASPGGGVLAYSWKAFPPPGAEEAAATFAPGPTGTAPSVSLGSPGTAMAGPWSMRVRVRNEQGLVAQDLQVVNVGNRSPSISTPARFSAQHRYEAARFLADVALLVGATDPDGDPVEAGFTLSASGGHACSHGFAPVAPTSAQLTLSCPDPTELIGGVAWTVGAAVEDVNGASDAGTVPLEILNRPPTFAMEGGSAIPAYATVAHAFGPCAQAGAQCFRTADEPGIVALDPDGDPLEASAAPGIAAGRSHSRGTASIGGDGVARFAFETDEAYPLEFRAIDGSTGFSVEGAAVDPFGATASLSLPVRVSNTPPVIEVPAPDVSAGHVYDRSSDRYRVPAFVVARISDPDGDPVLGGGIGDALCTVFGGEGTVEVGCGLPYASGGTVQPPLGDLVGDHPLGAVAQDAWDPTWAAMTLRVENQRPVPDAPYTFSTSSAACVCVCSVESDKGVCLGRDWVSGFVEVPVRFAEPDHDPVLAGGAVCLPGSCTVRRGDGTHQIVLDDGVAAATAQFTVSVDCTPSGTCGP